MISVNDTHELLSGDTPIGIIQVVGIHPPDGIYFTVDLADGFNLKLNGGPFFDCKMPPGGYDIEKVWVELNQADTEPAQIMFRWKIR